MSGTVTINGTDYTIYGTRAAADAYWESSLGPYADAWEANTVKRDRALVQARRLLDRIQWIAEADTFAERDAIENFQLASYEIAAALIVDPNLFTSETSGKNIKAIYAGDGVGVQFFMPTLGITGRFPVQIQELIGVYLAGQQAGSVSGSYSSGTSPSDSAGGTTMGEGLFDLQRGF
jgi:hypothetical protein